MSTRVSKDIGYFLSAKKINKILIKDWVDRIENFDDSALALAIKAEIELSVGLGLDNAYVNYLLASDKWEMEALITPSYDFDKFKGVLFKTPELNSERRFDAAVDYYSEPDMKYKINDFFRPIYPRNGYIYVGGITDFKIINKIESFLGCKLNIGTLIEGQNIGFVVRAMGFNSSNKYGDFVKQVKKTKTLIPDVDPLVYVLAKVAGILKIGVSDYDFRTSVRPAIITSWG